MCNSINNPDEFNKLSSEEQNELLDWIKLNLTPIKTINKNHNSYDLKHFFEKSANGFYISNGAFKGAMIKSGYTYDKKLDSLNWRFNISKKSKCFK